MIGLDTDDDRRFGFMHPRRYPLNDTNTFDGGGPDRSRGTQWSRHSEIREDERPRGSKMTFERN